MRSPLRVAALPMPSSGRRASSSGHITAGDPSSLHHRLRLSAVLAVDPQSPETLYVVDRRRSHLRDEGRRRQLEESCRRPRFRRPLKSLRWPSTRRTREPCTRAPPTSPIAAMAGTASTRAATVARRGARSSGTDYGPRELSLLAIDPRNPKNLHATGDLYYRSDDGGTTWKTPYVTQSLDNVGVGALALDPSEPATMYLGTDDARVFKSTDGGANWRDLNVSFKDISQRTASPPLP